MTDVTLTIEFGGLCMFVSRQNPDRLFALLPNHTMMPPRHCPMLVVPTGSDKAMLYSLKHSELDLGKLQSYISKPTGSYDLSETLQVSKYSGAKVDDKWLTGQLKGMLVSRVKLPPGADLECAGDRVDIGVEGMTEPVPVAGRVSATMTLEKFTKPTLDIGAAHIAVKDVPTVYITVYILNIRRCDLTRTAPRSHMKGDLVHGNIYYSLLEPYGIGAEGKELTVYEPPINPDDSPCEDKGCPSPSGEPDDFTPPGDGWIDTHDCAIGTGS